MASIFARGFVAYAFGNFFSKTVYSKKLWLLGIFFAISPDADVLGFKFSIAYEDFWRHRGFSHSLVFILILATVLIFLYQYALF